MIRFGFLLFLSGYIGLVSTQKAEPIICDCGFLDESNQLWSQIWYSDYSQYKILSSTDRFHQLMDYTVQSKAKNSLDRIFSPHNVKLTLQGLSLSVKKNQNKYTSASIGTKRSDFLYGTFRARMKTSQVPGTVAAFFYYHNVSSEIDMETLSRLTNPWQTYFAVQPQIYNKDGSASPLTHQKYGLGFDPTQGYHEYRFDWTPGIVKFFVDGVHVGEMTTHVPSTPGRIMVNHWTDGNPNFSGGPPENNTELVVSHLNLFFNSSESKEILVCQKRKAPCRVQDIMSNYIVPASHTSSAGILFPSCLICFSILFYLLFSIFVV